MEQLKLKRVPLRTAFTRTLNNLNEELEKENQNISDIEVLLEQLEDKNGRLKDSDQQVLEHMLSVKISEDEYVKEFESCENYTERFIGIKAKVKKLVTGTIKFDYLPVPNPAENSDIRFTAASFKLPKINLIEFDGDPRNWLSFWNTFKKIHEDRSLDDHAKFVYLIQSTVPKSKAREIVQSFPTTEENYPKVIEHLKNRFGREDVLIQLYVRDLLNIVLTNNSGGSKKGVNLSTLYDNLETKLRSLESLGVTEDKYASILFPLVESCLPTDILLIWEREREKAAQGKSNLESILQFLKNEVLSEERLMYARFPLDKTRKPPKTNISDEFNVATCNDLYTGDKFKERITTKRVEELCLFCDKSHPSEKCFKANGLSYEDKRNLIFKKGACFVCLKRNHISRDCRSKIKCIICGRRHSIIICQQIPSQAKENRLETSSEVKGNE